jgi:hypothetical protein
LSAGWSGISQGVRQWGQVTWTDISLPRDATSGAIAVQGARLESKIVAHEVEGWQ